MDWDAFRPTQFENVAERVALSTRFGLMGNAVYLVVHRR